MANHIAVCDLRRLLHHLPQAPGQLEAAVQGVYLGRLDNQGRAPQGSPGQAGGYPQSAHRLIGLEWRPAQQIIDILFANAQFVLFLVQQTHNGLAHDARQLLFQCAHAGFATIRVNHVLEARVVDLQLLVIEPMALQLLGPQVFARNTELFLRHIA